jgi:hypothetical protein
MSTAESDAHKLHTVNDIPPQDRMTKAEARTNRLEGWVYDCALMHRSCRENRGVEAYPLWSDPGHTRSQKDITIRPKRVLELTAEDVLVLHESKSMSTSYEYVTSVVARTLRELGSLQ